MSAWKQILTGANNQTLAIGRVLGFPLGIILLGAIPFASVLTLWAKWIGSDDWSKLLTALALYIPAVSGGMAGLIWGTNKTEPTQHPHDDGGNANG